jgi:hypothetical protein
VKPIKMFGLAALAALMAMAFVGAGSAMAEETQLCKVDPGTTSPLKCPAGEATTEVHETSVTKAVLVTSVVTVECDVLFQSTSVGALAKPQIVTGNFTYTNCGNCTVTEKSGTSSEIKVLKLGHELSDVTGEGEVRVVCSGFIDCTYKGEGLLGHGLPAVRRRRTERSGWRVSRPLRSPAASSARKTLR